MNRKSRRENVKSSILPQLDVISGEKSEFAFAISLPPSLIDLNGL